MTEDQGESLGEIGRSMKRLEVAFAAHQTESRARFHELANKINDALAPISVHGVQIESQQQAIGRLDTDMKAVTKDANRIAGAGAILAIIAGIIPWPWKS